MNKKKAQTILLVSYKSKHNDNFILTLLYNLVYDNKKTTTDNHYTPKYLVYEFNHCR